MATEPSIPITQATGVPQEDLDHGHKHLWWYHDAKTPEGQTDKEDSVGSKISQAFHKLELKFQKGVHRFEDVIHVEKMVRDLRLV